MQVDPLSFGAGCAVSAALCYGFVSGQLLPAPSGAKKRGRSRDEETVLTPPKMSPALPAPLNVAPPASLEVKSGQVPVAKKDQLKFAEADQVFDLRRGWIAPEVPPKPVGDSDDLFTVYNRSYGAQSGDDTFVHLEIKRNSLLDTLKRFFPSTGTLYEMKPSIDARDIYVKLPEIRAQLDKLGESERQAFEVLLNLVQSKFARMQINHLWPQELAALPQGMISWRLLWTLFETGSEIEAIQDSSLEPMAFNLDSWSYGSDSNGRAFVLKCHYYQWTGVSFQKVNTQRKIIEYDNLAHVSDIVVKPLTKERKAKLAERGSRYVQFAGQCHADYTGPFISRAFAGVVRLPGRGQAIVDVKGFRRINPTLDVWNDDAHQTPEREAEQARATFEAAYYHLLPPTLHGFSFPNKKWGELMIDHLHHINWAKKHSFDHLVIPDSYRNVIRALVDVHSGKLKDSLIEDVVEGKGAGLILTLHGRPGTGKTLTAEAVADHLKRPLYAVSAGELGMNPTNLERQLKDILELATSWRAVLLIDEADVFLEKRNSTQLDRNALVGVFLRLLEYFQGVLILTTNHIDHFDEAFASRFTISLAFDDLNEASRRTLWIRFLNMVYRDKGEGDMARMFDLDRLSKPELNGRVIRRVVRTAQALALFERADMTMDHLETVLSFDN